MHKVIKQTFFLQGTNSTGGKEDIIPRICAKQDVPSYTIKQMQAVTIRFASNRDDENSGVIAGYASYKKGYCFFLLLQPVKLLISNLSGPEAVSDHLLVIDQKL